MEPTWADHLREIRSSASNLLHPEAGAGPTTDRSALTWGRYQIVSIMHLDNIRTILRNWTKVTICVLDLDQGPTIPARIPKELSDFYSRVKVNTDPPRNPMTATERVAVWRAALEAAGMADRATVTAIPMPYPDPERFNRQFPPDRFDLVFPTASDAELKITDRVRVLGRPVLTYRPPMKFHTSDIRISYRQGTDVWRTALAPGTLETFQEFDGPHRVLGLDPSTDKSPSVSPAPALAAFPRVVRQTPKNIPNQPNPTEKPKSHIYQRDDSNPER